MGDIPSQLSFVSISIDVDDASMIWSFVVLVSSFKDFSCRKVLPTNAYLFCIQHEPFEDFIFLRDSLLESIHFTEFPTAMEDLACTEDFHALPVQFTLTELAMAKGTVHID